ncbi:MAG: S9 family peptidase [Acidimicrobiales bacterium]
MDASAPRPASPPSAPPAAKKVPVERRHHGDVVVDDYAWLRDRDDPDTVAYLAAENAWIAAALAHTEALQETLFEEIRARVQETDLSSPVRKGRWSYYTRTEEGRQYPIHCRRPATGDHTYDESAPEQVLLDENLEAEGHEYFALGAFDVSPDHRLLAYSVDHEGDELYTMRFRDLDTGENLAEEIPEVYYGTAWALDSTTFFYVKTDDAMRPHQLWRRRLRSGEADALVYTEADDRFYLGVELSRDERWIIVHLGSKVTDEVRVLPADRPEAEPVPLAEREQEVEYSAEPHGDRWFILTNADGAENFKIVEAPADAPGRAGWREVVPHDPAVKLSAIDAFRDHLVIYERAEGVRRIRVLRLSDGAQHVIDQPEAVSTASGSVNPEFDTTSLRYAYQSMITPSSVYAYDLDTRDRRLLKQQPVLGGYDPERYATERVWAQTDDGAKAPISLVYRRGLPRDGSAPALLYGYGAYEASTDPYFSSIRLSLLDRGFVFAIAHVRGGGEMGRRWYTEGKYLHKRNTFTDFVACARALCEQGWTSPGRLAIRGGSAGGLLVGAVLNLAPEQFGAAVAEVPFVDALNTILDPTLPLTVLEWEEWGNPLESAEYYAYMKSYSPYENVEPKAYPPLLVTAGLNDPRVSYWEPAKWVAKLRALKTDANPLLLKTEMGAGHGGPTGRYRVWRDEAMVLAFVIDAVGGA